MLAALARAAARAGRPIAARAAAAPRALPALTRPPAAHGLAGLAGLAGIGRLLLPSTSHPSLLPFAVALAAGTRSVATKQPKASGAKMKSLSCWKRRFKLAGGGGAAGVLVLRMRAGHRHKRSVKPPHVRRRLRTRTVVADALAKKMVVRGFTRTRLS